MTANHPYPAHIVDKLAALHYEQRWSHFGKPDPPWHDLGEYSKNHYRNDIETLLQALWDASRVDTMEQVEQLPDHSFLVDVSGCCIAETPEDDRVIPSYLPAHVIYWGNHA